GRGVTRRGGAVGSGDAVAVAQHSQVVPQVAGEEEGEGADGDRVVVRGPPELPDAGPEAPQEDQVRLTNAHPFARQIRQGALVEAAALDVEILVEARLRRLRVAA